MVRPLGKLLHCLVPRPCYLLSQFVFVQVVLSTKHSHHLTAGVRAVKKPSTIGDKLLREFSSNRVHRRTKQSVPPPSLYSKLGHGVCCSLQVAVTGHHIAWRGWGLKASIYPSFERVQKNVTKALSGKVLQLILSVIVGTAPTCMAVNV